MDRAEEGRLLRQAQRGDADAFAALYREHVQVIYRYIVHRVGDHHLAEDLTADVFTKALQGLDRYREQGKPLVAWLYRIARARVIDHYRRTSRRPVESDVEAEPLPFDADLDTPMVRREAARVLRAAIAELTEDQQQVVILRFVEGYRVEAIASLMGKQPNAIKALQHRALRTLANRLARAGFDIESVLAGIS
ncbi:MAG: sigma-70 family RNA polymerase sigma factor [Anaerolineae bacterium]|nr:sigma-70 family RNA polymerase sigma factor [Anaerolineae bacterium]